MKESNRVLLIAATMLLVVAGTVILAHNLAAPIVQKETGTGTVVAVITYDGTVQPPSYFESVKGRGYDIEWVAPGYRPAEYGVKEWELKDSR